MNRRYTVLVSDEGVGVDLPPAESSTSGVLSAAAIIEAISEALIVTDLNETIVHLNGACEDVLDASGLDLRGHNISSLESADLRRVIGAMKNGGFGTVVRKLTIKEREYEARSSVIRLPTDEPVGVVTVLHDISELLAVDRMKDELLATVNHELRTPLTSLRGFAELLYERDLPRADQKAFLKIILGETERLTDLISDFLDIQKIEAGKMRFQLDVTDDFGALVREQVATFALQREDKHTFDLSVEPRLPKVAIDADRIRQVLMNLLSNAVKFSPDGGPIGVTVSRSEDDNVIVSVRDQGIGIPEEAVEQLFSRFFRVDNRATRSVGGSGLGLAIVKELVEGHGGRVWVESTLGVGTEFFFTIPDYRGGR